MDASVDIEWDDLRASLRGLANAGGEIADESMRRTADLAAGYARDLAPGSLSALVDVERKGEGEYAVVGRTRSGRSDEQVFNMHTHGTLGNRTKKKRTRNSGRAGGIRPKNILTRARTRAKKRVPEFIVEAMVRQGKRTGWTMRRGA